MSPCGLYWPCGIRACRALTGLNVNNLPQCTAPPRGRGNPPTWRHLPMRPAGLPRGPQGPGLYRPSYCSMGPTGPVQALMRPRGLTTSPKGIKRSRGLTTSPKGIKYEEASRPLLLAPARATGKASRPSQPGKRPPVLRTGELAAKAASSVPGEKAGIPTYRYHQPCRG